MSLSSRLLDKTAEIQKSLDELNQMIVEKDFKPPQAEPKKEQPLMSQSGSLKKDLPPVEKAAPVKSEISVDWELLDYLKYGQVIKPKKFLGDLWSGIDQVLKANNYKWIRDGKESRWEFQVVQATETQEAAALTKDKAAKTIRISEIADQKSVSIEGELQYDPEQRDVNTKKGPATVTSFKVGDGSGVAKITFWGDAGDAVMGLAKGNRVRVTALMVGTPYDGAPQLTAGKYTKVIAC